MRPVRLTVVPGASVSTGPLPPLTVSVPWTSTDENAGSAPHVVLCVSVLPRTCCAYPEPVIAGPAATKFAQKSAAPTPTSAPAPKVPTRIVPKVGTLLASLANAVPSMPVTVTLEIVGDDDANASPSPPGPAIVVVPVSPPPGPGIMSVSVNAIPA
jgi:hypothetical protein